MQIISLGDNTRENIKSVFLGKQKNKIKMTSEIFVMCLHVGGIENSTDPDQTAPLGGILLS